MVVTGGCSTPDPAAAPVRNYLSFYPGLCGSADVIWSTVRRLQACGGRQATPELRDASRHGEQHYPIRAGNPDWPGVGQVTAGAADQGPDDHVDQDGDRRKAAV